MSPEEKAVLWRRGRQAAAALRRGEHLDVLEKAVEGKRRVSAATIRNAIASVKFRQEELAQHCVFALRSDTP